jgi:hypothetical protein
MSHLRDSSRTLVLNMGQRQPAELDFGPNELMGTAREH